MRAKDFLKQVNKIDRMIANKQDEIEQWRSIAQSTAAPINIDRVQISSSQQKMADATVEYLTIEQELRQEIDRLRSVRRDVISVIEQLPEKQYDVMYKVYIKNLTFQQVADLQRTTKSCVSNIHRKAVKNVQLILDRREDERLSE